MGSWPIAGVLHEHLSRFQRIDKRPGGGLRSLSTQEQRHDVFGHEILGIGNISNDGRWSVMGNWLVCRMLHNPKSLQLRITAMVAFDAPCLMYHFDLREVVCNGELAHCRGVT